MSLLHESKFFAFSKTKLFLKEHGDELTTFLARIGVARSGFVTLFETQREPMRDLEEGSHSTTLFKNMIKTECFNSVLKLTAALQYHYRITGDKIAANNVKMTESKLSRLSVQAFYIFSQMVMIQYDPDLHNSYGLVTTEMDALRKKLTEFPLLMKASDEARLKRKTAGKLLNTIQKNISDYLKYEFDPLMLIARDEFPIFYGLYRESRKYGLVSITKGKPHYKGQLNPGEIVVLDKKSFRSKMALIVNCTGASPLMAGIGIKETEMKGTPFIIEPGKLRKRISQKLASEGEYILLQNVGEEVTGYKVWLKE